MQPVRSLLLIAFLFVVLGGAAPGSEPPTRDHDITVDDYFTIGVVTGIALSPDGRYVAYTEQRWEPPAERRNTDLWVVECASKSIRRLTFDRAGDTGPQWSPDGKHIYFRSNRRRGEEEHPPHNGTAQVWRVSPEGGTPVPVTQVPDGIGLFELAADGQALYYTTSREVVDDEWKSLRTRYADLEYGHGVTSFSQVWKLDLVHWRAEKLIDEKRVIGALAVSPDGSRVGMITTPDENLITNEGRSRVDVFDVATGEVWSGTDEAWRENHPSPFGWLEGLSWSDDGDALAFAIFYDGFPSEVYVAEWIDDRPSVRKLDRPKRVTVADGAPQWRGKTRTLCYIGEERGRRRVYAIDEVSNKSQGRTRVMTAGDMVVTAFDAGSAGASLATVQSTTDHPGDVILLSNAGEPQRLTTVNPQIDTWKKPRISLVQWEGAHGDEVEGILELPPDYKPSDGPLPMILEIHGGPTSASLYRFRFWIYGRTLLAAKGYALLSPNYRGSTGYGDKFMTDLIGHENDIEVRDILAGVDAMIERGIADPNRLGVMGWSNGGFLTNAVITHTDRFKAASSGAGLVDMVIHWGTEDTPGHVINYMQGLPWQVPEAYRKASPLFNLHKVRTPTLIQVGSEDPRHTAAHSRALFRGLHHYLKVPTELVIYPGEGHGLSTYANRKAKMEWDHAWFQRYVLGEVASGDAASGDAD